MTQDIIQYALEQAIDRALTEFAEETKLVPAPLSEYVNCLFAAAAEHRRQQSQNSELKNRLILASL